MAPAIIYTNLTDQLVGALCNMLIHSLWQGLVLAAAAGLIVICTKKASPVVRYNLLIGALLLFVTAAVITFAVKFNGTQRLATPAVFLRQPAQSAVIDFKPALAAPTIKAEVGSITATLYNYVNTYHNTIVLVWFLIICAKSIRFGIGLQGVYLLKHSKVFAAAAEWQQRAAQLAVRLGISQTIRLLESGLARVPMVVGHLKPVILIPIGLLTALSVEEVDAILVHELAHIRRRDYLINLLQSLAEILFFFNPAVLWISQLIKTERENCCDDMALAETSSKVDYIRALVSCQEYQQAVPAYAMGFPGGKNSLVDRAKRMLGSRNHSLNTFEKGLLTVCLVISGLCLSAFAEKENIKRAAHAIVKVFQPAKPAKNQQQGQAAILQKQEAAARANAPLPAKSELYFQPEDDTVKIVSAQPNVQAVLPVQAKLKRLDSLNVHVNVKSAALAVVANPQVKLDRIDTTVNSRVSTHEKTVTSSRKQSLKQLDSLDAVYKADILGQEAHVKDPVFASGSKSDLKRQITEELIKDGLIEKDKPLHFTLSANEFIVNGTKQPEEIFRKYRRFYSHVVEYRRDMSAKDQYTMNHIIVQLVKDGIVGSSDDALSSLSFKLTNSEFIVNDKKQPVDVLKKYSDEFIKATPGGQSTWYYKYNTTSKN